MGERWQCDECGAIRDRRQLLVDKNPFDNTETIYGCPNCFSIDRFTRICDDDGCNLPVSSGWNDETGKRRATCYKHSGAHHYPGREKS